MIAGKNKSILNGYKSIYSGAQVDNAVELAALITSIDLENTSSDTLFVNHYYRHIGQSGDKYIQNVIYCYNGEDLLPVNGGGGEDNVQSDWNQNDETAADYIKNRPFYSRSDDTSNYKYDTFMGLQKEGDNIVFTWFDKSYECPIISEKGLAVCQLDSGSFGNAALASEPIGSVDDDIFVYGGVEFKNYYEYFPSLFPSNLTNVSEQLSIIVNDNEYLCPLNYFEDDNVFICGATTNEEIGSYPFLLKFLINDSGEYLVLYTFEPTNKITISLPKDEVVYLDSKYIKDMYYTKENVVSKKTNYLQIYAKYSDIQNDSEGFITYNTKSYQTHSNEIMSLVDNDEAFVGKGYTKKSDDLTQTYVAIGLNFNNDTSYIDIGTNLGCMFSSCYELNEILPEKVTFLYNEKEYECSRTVLKYSTTDFYIYGNLSFLSEDVIDFFGLTVEDTGEPFIFCSNFELIFSGDSGCSFIGKEPFKSGSMFAIYTKGEEESVKTIDKKYLPKDTTYVITLKTGDWGGNVQTISVIGLQKDDNVFVSPAGDPTAYANAGIWCSKQNKNSLTFTCSTTPSADIKVNLLIR